MIKIKSFTTYKIHFRSFESIDWMNMIENQWISWKKKEEREQTVKYHRGLAKYRI